jgi:Ni/Fe-hydrogenase subunit HybB-like protein
MIDLYMVLYNDSGVLATHFVPAGYGADSYVYSMWRVVFRSDTMFDFLNIIFHLNSTAPIGTPIMIMENDASDVAADILRMCAL